MKKFKYEFEVDDDFEVGDCYECSLGEWTWYHYDDDCYRHCVIGGNSENCPLKEVKNSIENEMVYCTECKHFRINDEGNPTCSYEDICDITGCEDSRHRENRPYYEEINGKNK